MRPIDKILWVLGSVNLGGCVWAAVRGEAVSAGAGATGAAICLSLFFWNAITHNRNSTERSDEPPRKNENAARMGPRGGP